MPYKNSKKVTEQLFNTVTAQLKSNPATADMYIVIAKANGIGVSTVKQIRRDGTWKNYSDKKASKVAHKKQSAIKQLDAIVAKPENQIRAKTKYINITADDWNALQAEFRQIHRRLDFVNSRVGKLEVPARHRNPLSGIWRSK